MLHDIHQEDDLPVGELGTQDRRFDTLRVKYITLDSVKSIMFTKLEFSTSLR